MENVSPILAPDKTQMLQHLEILFGRALAGRIEITGIHVDKDAPGRARTRFFAPDDLDAAVDYAATLNAEGGRNVYVGAALRRDEVFPGKAADDSDFLKTYALWADADNEAQLQSARVAYAERGCDPAWVVITGRTPERRAQLWWPLEAPLDDIETVRSATRGIAGTLGTDRGVCTGKQLMRLAGTVAWPKPNKPGRVLERTELYRVERAAREFPLEQITRAFPPGEAPPQATGLKELIGPERRAQADRFAQTFQDGGWHQGALEFTASLVQRGYGLDDILALAPAFQRPGHTLEATEADLRVLAEGALKKYAPASKAYIEPRPASETAEPQETPTEGGQPAFDPWERYVVPKFPMAVLPPVLRDFVGYLTVTTGADPAACAMSALTACAGALDQRFTLKMKRTGDWFVRPRLWTMLVGDPSTRKTPLMSACVRPLREAENKVVSQYQREMARWKEMSKEDRGDEPPLPTRYIFNDITTEKIGDILTRQDRGALYENDEMSGWLGAMDKYAAGKGSSVDRSFWAKAYNGGAHTIDRLSRGESYVQNLCVSVLGAIQPDRLTDISKLTTDGLLQRFLPVMMRRAQFPAEVADDAPAAAYGTLLSYLIGMRPNGLVMDEGGRAAAEAFQRFVFELENTEGLGKSFSTFLGKLPGVHGSIALLLHLVEDPAEAPLAPVPERLVIAAAQILREFIIPHALEFYRGTTDGADWEAIQTLASFVLTSGKDRFVRSDFTSGVSALRGLGTWETAQKVSPLVAGGWLEEEVQGGVVKAWTVVKGLREALTERREMEIQRKAKAYRTLRNLTEGTDDA